MDAEAIVRAASEKYSACLSYEDHGEIENHLTTLRTTGQALFSTVFIRPSMMKFDFETMPSDPEEKLNLTLTANGDSVTAGSLVGSTPHVKSYVSLSDAALSLKGVTWRVLPLISGLLNESTPNVLSILSDTQRLEDELINDEPCFKIAARNVSANDVHLWLSNEFALRKIRIVRNSNIDEKMIELMRTVFEAERQEFSEQAVRDALESQSTIHFNRVTFNNSVTIDALR